MNLTISSFRPLGAKSDSMSVVKPYLYLSTSISLTSSIVSRSAMILCRRSCFVAGQKPAPNSDEMLDTFNGGVPAQADPDCAARQIRGNVHGGEDVGLRHL